MSRTGGTVFILSDGTGETASTIVKAALVHYQDRDVSIVRCKNIRSEEQIENIIEEVQTREGAVVYTIVSPNLRAKIETLCQINNVPYKDLFGPLLSMFSSYFQKESNFTPGILRQTDEKYFKRIIFNCFNASCSETADFEVIFKDGINPIKYLSLLNIEQLTETFKK